METMKKILRRGAALLAVALFSGSIVIGVKAAGSLYPRIQASATEYFSTVGAKRWIWNLDSSNNLQLVENSNLSAAVIKVNTADGGLQIRSRTQTQISTLTPTAAGELVYNSSQKQICVSTGATAGAWVSAGQGDSVKIACYNGQ